MRVGSADDMLSQNIFSTGDILNCTVAGHHLVLNPSLQ
jgi:hypothetical protein